ncbi:MAG: PIN domain-containing protein [Mycobacteriales bacterium]
MDTSVFIAVESQRPLKTELLPAETAISVVTVAELQAGVLAAPTTHTRAARLATLQRLAATTIIPVDEAVALTWAQMRVHLADTKQRVNVNDLWIAASAAAHGLTLYSQDDDFEPLQTVAGLRVTMV